MSPFSIVFKIEIVTVLPLCLFPFFGHTYPELTATGWQGIFNSWYILDAPFLNGGLSPGETLVPCGKIISGLSELDNVFRILSKKFKLSFEISFLFIEIEPIFFNDTGSPALIKDPSDFDSIFVVMPMKGWCLITLIVTFFIHGI